MTAPTPRQEIIKTAMHDPSTVADMVQRIETELAQAKSENAALRKLLGKCKPAIELVLRDAVNLKLEGIAGVYRTLRDEINAALKEGR